VPVSIMSNYEGWRKRGSGNWIKSEGELRAVSVGVR